MMENTRHVTTQMQSLLEDWEVSKDQRAVFLSCYLLMTRNIVLAMDQGEFKDTKWVDQLMQRFAGYYFKAITHYEKESPATPAVWQLTLDASKDSETMVLQNLFLGVNAHINYDLILTLRELLEPEWSFLSEPERIVRYSDHCQVNEVIGRTIDSVQEQVIEERLPAMDFIDKIFGPFDERLTAWLIGKWRDEVWENAVRLVETPDLSERESILAQVESAALKKARLMLLM